ncbi:hypothetical protein EDC94DRAFT_678538 [Helicostylum pulchrum]|nr:hypothetical protein EDC94DRAFT_678538 [Helicostylum pulchrum]
MSSHENIKEETNQSRERIDGRVRQFVQVSFEMEAERQVAVLKEKAEVHVLGTSTSIPLPKQEEHDKVYVSNSDRSVGTTMKLKAIRLRENFHALDIQDKAIVSLDNNGINSDRKKYNVSEYQDLLKPLRTIDDLYNGSRSVDFNWLNIYKELKRLQSLYDQYIRSEYNDQDFIISMLLQILTVIKEHPYPFIDEIDVSECDLIVKFWGPVTELLFHLQILHGRTRQRYNVETDVGVSEATEKQAGDVKVSIMNNSQKSTSIEVNNEGTQRMVDNSSAMHRSNQMIIAQGMSRRPVNTIKAHIAKLEE